MLMEVLSDLSES